MTTNEMKSFFESGTDMFLISMDGLNLLIEVSSVLAKEGYLNTAVALYISAFVNNIRTDTVLYPEAEIHYLPLDRDDIINDIELYEYIVA